jgi:hypothetical protein
MSQYNFRRYSEKFRLYLPHEVLIGLPFFRSKPMHIGNTHILKDMIIEVLGDFGFNIKETSIDINKYVGVTKYDIDRLSSVCIYGNDIIFNALQKYRDLLHEEYITVSIEVKSDKKCNIVDNIIEIEREM